MPSHYPQHCECSDSGCPWHKGQRDCPSVIRRPGQGHLVRRIDMDDGLTTFLFCAPCMEAALDSGVFAYERGYY